MKRYLLAASAVLVLAGCQKKVDTTKQPLDASAASSAVTDTPSTAAPDGTPLSDAAPPLPASGAAPAT